MRAAAILTALWLSTVPVNAQTWNAREVGTIALSERSQAKSLALDDTTIYILDTGLGQISRFATNRKLEEKPAIAIGEFSEQALHVIIAGGRVTVIDPGLRRMTAYDSTGVVLHRWDLTMQEALATAWVAAGEDIVLLTPPIPEGFGFEEETPDHIIWSFTPSVSKPARIVMRLSLPTPIRFSPTGAIRVNLAIPKPLIAGTPGGPLLFALSDSYAITLLDSAGNRLKKWSRDIARVSYTALQQAEIRQRADSANQRAYAVGSAMSGTSGSSLAIEYDLPDAAPMITALVAGDSITLVGRDTENPHAASRWDVLDARGVFAGSVELPGGFRVLAAQRSRVWGVKTDNSSKKTVAVFELVPPAVLR